MYPRAVLPMVLLSSIIVSHFGCGNAQLTLYPEFLQKKEASKKSAIISDIAILEATESDTTKVDLVNNKQTAIELLDYVSELLNAKGYNVETRTLSSVGLLMEKRHPVKTISVPEDLQKEEVELPLMSPPLYIYPTFERDTTLLRILATVYLKLINTGKEEGQQNPIIQEAVPLGMLMGGDMLFVVLLGGYRVSAAREFGMVDALESDKHGRVAGHQTSQLSIMLFVLDTSTGAVIWSDRRDKRGGTVYKENIQRTAKHLIDNLP